MAGIVRERRLEGRHLERRHAALALMCGVVALSAFVGAIALATGTLGRSAALVDKIPWHNVMAGALLLALVIGVPMAVTAGCAVARDSRAATAAVVSGTVLICSVLALMLVASTLSWLQPVYLVLAVLIVGLGLHIRTETAGY